MNCEKIKEYVSKGFKLIDVRTPMEHQQARIEGSENVPLNDVANIRDEKVVVYCRSGARSSMAKSILDQIGIETIDVGGINRYMGCLEY